MMRPVETSITLRAFWEGTRTMQAKLPHREVSEVARGSNGGVGASHVFHP